MNEGKTVSSCLKLLHPLRYLDCIEALTEANCSFVEERPDRCSRQLEQTLSSGVLFAGEHGRFMLPVAGSLRRLDL